MKTLDTYVSDPFSFTGRILREWRESSLGRKVQIVILMPLLTLFWVVVAIGIVRLIF